MPKGHYDRTGISLGRRKLALPKRTKREERGLGATHWTPEEIARQWPGGYDIRPVAAEMVRRFGRGSDQGSPQGRME